MYEDFRELILNTLLKKANNMKISFENSLYKKKQREIVDLKNKLDMLKEKNAGLVDLFLEDKLITKLEFQTKRKEYQNDIEKINDQIYLMTQEENNQTDIKNIKEAFEQLKHHDEDLFYVFSKLIKRIVMHPDGEIDIDYTFDG